MKIFDGHTHIEQGFSGYDLSDVAHKNVIFNSIESYEKHRNQVSSSDVVSLIFDVKNTDFVVQEVKKAKIAALKIISREQKLTDEDYAYLLKNLALFPDHLPVILDAFYYGDDFEYQPSLTHMIKFAKAYPQKQFIIAHSGGYEVLKYFFHLRPLKNVHYDLSFSLQYLHDTSCYLDLKKLIHYTDKTRIMFGSDYFWASAKFQWDVLQNIFQELAIPNDQQEMIAFSNAKKLFG